MKNKYTKGEITIALLAAIVMTISALVILLPKLEVSKDNEVFSSVTAGNEYFSTTTKTSAGATMKNPAVLKTGAGALGSVIVTGAGAGVIYLYDATSTVTNAEWATTTLATIPASAAARTYTFDLVFNKGLYVEILGTVPTSTITYR